MHVKEFVNRFKEKRPIGLMARMSLARLLSPEAVDQVFHEHAVGNTKGRFRSPHSRS